MTPSRGRLDCEGKEKNKVREALRIAFFVIAAAAGIASPMARAEDRAANVEQRWLAPASEPFRCGGIKFNDYKSPPPDDYKTVERNQRARIKAILASSP